MFYRIYEQMCRFQKQGVIYDRQLLDCMYKYNDGWRFNVWTLGVMILELLNKRPLEKCFID